MLKKTVKNNSHTSENEKNIFSKMFSSLSNIVGQKGFYYPISFLVAFLVFAWGFYNWGYLAAEVKYIKGATGQSALTIKELPKFVSKNLKIKEATFKKCLADEGTLTSVRAEINKAIASGIGSTPSNFLLDLQTNKMIPLVGAVPLDNFNQALSILKSGVYPTQEEISAEGYAGPMVIDITIDRPLETDLKKGNENSRFALIEYSDFECPYCKRFHPTAKQFTDSNSDVMWIYRNFPLESIHPNALDYAKGAYCVNKVAGSDKFWEYADLLMSQN